MKVPTLPTRSMQSVRERILLTARQSADLLGMSLRKFHDACKEDDFPAARSFGPRSTRWVRSELEAYAVALLSATSKALMPSRP
jgi:predicted DNA-binding transcriptional regulator AlpA